MVSGKSVHFPAEDSNIQMPAQSVIPCNQLCVFLATVVTLREDQIAPHHFDAEGNLDETHNCVLLQQRKQ